jgi:hypothetical protein
MNLLLSLALEQPALHAPFLSYSGHADALRVQFPALWGGVFPPVPRIRATTTTITISLPIPFATDSLTLNVVVVVYPVLSVRVDFACFFFGLLVL